MAKQPNDRSQDDSEIVDLPMPPVPTCWNHGKPMVLVFSNKDERRWKCPQAGCPVDWTVPAS